MGTTRDSSKAVSSSEEQKNAFETANDKQSVQGNMFSNNDPVEKKRQVKTSGRSIADERESYWERRKEITLRQRNLATRGGRENCKHKSR